MALETVFAIIISVAAVGHVASHGEASGIHSAAKTEQVAPLDRDTSECIAEAKESFDYASVSDGEDLVGHIETECYQDDD